MKNEYIVSQELYKSWVIENMFKGKRKVDCLFGILGIGLCFWDAVSIYRPVWILFTLYCFFRAFFADLLFAGKRYNELVKAYGQENWTRTVSFGEDHITVTEPILSFKYKYSDIQEIREKEDKIWLLFNDQKVLRLYKSGFSGGDWEECKQLLENKRKSAGENSGIHVRKSIF